jgi:hypothetical protein
LTDGAGVVAVPKGLGNTRKNFGGVRELRREDRMAIPWPARQPGWIQQRPLDCDQLFVELTQLWRRGSLERLQATLVEVRGSQAHLRGGLLDVA